MGSGRGDRNQLHEIVHCCLRVTDWLQWGPVVVTGISGGSEVWSDHSYDASMGSGRGDRNQFTTRL